MNPRLRGGRPLKLLSFLEPNFPIFLPGVRFNPNTDRSTMKTKARQFTSCNCTKPSSRSSQCLGLLGKALVERSSLCQLGEVTLRKLFFDETLNASKQLSLFPVVHCDESEYSRTRLYCTRDVADYELQ